MIHRGSAKALCVVALLAATAPGCGGTERPRAGLDASADAAADGPTSPDAADAGEAADAGAVACGAWPGDAGAGAAGAGVELAVDPTTTLSTFTPARIFGINSAYWLVPGDVQQTQRKVQAAGTYFIRYPGGSSSDDYHWNGTGAYDPQGRWAPSRTDYSPGFPGAEVYRGTTSVSYGTPAHVTDGDESTAWLSNTDTDFADQQWVYVDLGRSASVDSIAIDWGTPYAATFRVQSWPTAADYPPPYQGLSTSWQTISGGGDVAGVPGTQTVSFPPAQARYVRVLMTASSAGAGGAYSVAELRVFAGGAQVTSNVASTAQSPTTASTTDPASAPVAQSNFDFESFMTYVRSFSPQATPVVTVNVGTGTAAEAAAWVHYANAVRGYGIRYWQIGNEMEGSWETGGPLNAQDYVRRYAAYYAAMKAEDPSITILGPVSGGIQEPSNLDDGQTFLHDFLSILHARGLDGYVDGLDFHWYPNYGAVPWDASLATTSEIGAFAASLRGWLTTLGMASSLPVFMTEYNEALGSPNTPVSVNQLVAGLWTADALGQFIRHFGAGGGTNLWNAISAGPTADATDPTDGDLGYLQYNHNAWRFQERAQYWAMQMMSTDWAISGDARDHRLVAVSSSPAPLLAAYADARPDGALALLVVNKDQSNACPATVRIPAGAAGSVADVWTFDATNYAWQTSTAPYHADPDTAPTHGVYCVPPSAADGDAAGVAVPFTFAPASITVLRFASPDGGALDGGGVEDASNPADAGASTVLIDDMSGPVAQIRLPPTVPGAAAGYWYTFIGGGAGPGDTGSITPLAGSEVADGAAPVFAYTAIGAGSDAGVPAPPGAPGETRAACAWGQTPAAQYAFAAEGFSLESMLTDAGYVAPYVDISAFSGIEFWMYDALPTPATVRVQIPDKESDPKGGVCGHATDGSTLDQCYSAVYEDITVPPGWSFQVVPFSALAVNPYYGYQQPAGGDMTTATDVQFEITQPIAPAAPGGGPVPFDFCVGQISLYR